MKAFNVYRHPLRGVEAVKVGFSWPAATFGPVWMLVKNLWAILGLWLAGFLALALVESLVERFELSGTTALVYLLIAAGYFALALIPGFKGNAWRERNLIQQGFEKLGSVQAETAETAMAKVTT
jgi:hypothetical protein